MPINVGYTELKIFSWFVRRTGLCIQDRLTSKQVEYCGLIYVEHPFLMFLDHTQRRSTVGRTPLDE